MQLIKSIISQARYRESQPAIAFPGGVATYGALIKATAAAAEALKVFDLPAGRAVMLDIRNPIHHTALMFAAALLGLPTASVGTTFVAEKAGVLPTLFLTDREVTHDTAIRTVRVDDRWFASGQTSPDYLGLLNLPGFRTAAEVARYVYSSGTTGFPKCVALTEQIIERRMSRYALSTPWWMSGQSNLNLLGFSTIAGTMAPLSAHARGALLCYGNIADALQMVHLFGVSGLALSVGQLQTVIQLLGSDTPPPSLRFLTVIGAKISPAMLTTA